MSGRRLAILLFVSALPIAALFGKNRGLLAGESGAPANLTKALPSCGKCHPATPNAYGKVQVQVQVPRSFPKGQSVVATISVAGGPNSGYGGFSMTSTMRGLGMKTNSRTNPLGTEATHLSPVSRNWQVRFAPLATGLVSWHIVALAANGDSRKSGDSWGFYGPDSSVPGIPFRLFVNASSVATLGSACAGTKGFRPLLGIAKDLAEGSAAAIELHEARPNSVALLVLGASTSAWGPFKLPLDLSPLGAPGCKLYVSLDFTLPAVTKDGGSGDGTAVWNLPVPSGLGLKGKVLHCQALVFDAGANAFGLVASQALSATVQ